MHRVCSLEIKVLTSILSSLTSSARNQIQMAPARLNCLLLHSVHPRFKEEV